MLVAWLYVAELAQAKKDFIKIPCGIFTFSCNMFKAMSVITWKSDSLACRWWLLGHLLFALDWRKLCGTQVGFHLVHLAVSMKTYESMQHVTSEASVAHAPEANAVDSVSDSHTMASAA